MLKAAGCLLILAASLLYGFRYSWELKEHGEQLAAMKEMFLMLSGEISYTRTPLREAFIQIAAQNKEPFAGFLKKAADQLLESEEENVGVFWHKLVEKEAGRFLLSEEELELLKRSGENFGYLDREMQLKNLEWYTKQTETLLDQFQGEVKEKQKLSQCLCLMCGLFLIILLV